MKDDYFDNPLDFQNINSHKSIELEEEDKEEFKVPIN
jgi:hypothetical protein